MTRNTNEPTIGSREAAKANARIRAREEGVLIYVLRYRDGERSYTASRHSEFTASRHPEFGQHPTETHGYYNPRGHWSPRIVMDVDDAVALLRVHGRDMEAALIEERRGDREDAGQ